MAGKKNIEKMILNFVKNSTSEFSLELLSSHIYEQTGKDHNDYIAEFIESYDFLDITVEKKIKKDGLVQKLFLSRKNLFEGAEFLFYPNEMEINGSYLIRGHRFMPFCASDCLKEIKVYDNDSRNGMKNKCITSNLNDSAPFYMLKGIERFIIELTSNGLNPSLLNEIMDGNNPLISLNVIDMTDFYKKYGFKMGDYILVKCQDYENAEFLFTHIPSEKITSKEKERTKWKNELVKSSLKVIKEFAANEDLENFNIERELSLIYYNSSINLLKSPVMTLSEAVIKADKIELLQKKAGTIIWEKGREYISQTEQLIDDAVDMVSQGNNNFLSIKSVGSLKTFDDVLEYMGYVLTESDVRSYAMDELYSGKGKGSIENIKNRCFDERTELYPEAAVKFEKLLQKIWDNSVLKYNYSSDSTIGESRKKLLNILDKDRMWQRKLDSNGIGLDKIPKKLLASALELNTFISSSLDFISNPKKMTNKEAKEMKVLMEQAMPMFEMSIAAINKEIDKIIKAKIR